MHRQDDNPARHLPPLHLSDNLKAAERRHIDVENRHVGRQFADHCKRRLAVGRFPDNIKRHLRLDDLPQPPAKDGMIVGNKYSYSFTH